MLKSLRFIMPFSFFVVIIYIIFLANTANYNMGFAMVQSIPYGDKLMHALLYGVMAMLLNYGLGYRELGWFQLGAVVVLGFAIIEECTQYFIPNRSFDLFDIVADIVGVVLFSLRWFRLVFEKKRYNKK